MPERTALASIEWARTRAVVRDLAAAATESWIAIPTPRSASSSEITWLQGL
jgi:hypothetical protein